MNFKKISNFFPAPKFLDIPYAGISITDDAIRCIQFERKNDGLYIEKHMEKELPRDLVVSGQINDKGALVRILTELKNDLKLDSVKVSLPEEMAYLFTAKIPRVSQKDIRSAIESKIEENVPVLPSELLFDYKIMDYSQADYFIVVVSALPISFINLYVSLFEEVGLHLISLEIESQAIARALIPREKEKNRGTVLIINFNKDKVGLYISVNRVVHFTSTLIIKNDLSKKPDLLAQEIKRLYVYWHTLKQNAGKPEKKISKIIVCGFGFDDNIINFISSSSQTPVEVGNVWTNVFDLNKNIPEISFSDSLKYAISVGLALPSSILIQK